MIEEDASTQEYDDQGSSDNQWYETQNSILFALLSFSSWILLTTYILSSLANPFAFIAIANHRYWDPNPNCPNRCDCNCSCRCSSISCLLYSMAAANIILALAAYYTGFVILYTYPLFFGIESPVDIVLAP
eukprot:779451_1